MQSTPHPPVSIRRSSYSVFPTSIVHPTSHTTTALAYVSATPYKDAMTSPAGTFSSASWQSKYAFGNTLKRFVCIAPVEDQYAPISDHEEASEQVDPTTEVEGPDNDAGYSRFSKFAFSILRCPSLGWIALRNRVRGPSASQIDGLPSIHEPSPKLRISRPAPLSSHARISRQPQAGPSTTIPHHSTGHLRPSRLITAYPNNRSSYSVAKRSSSPYGASSQTSSMSGGSAIWKVRPSPVLPGSRPGLPPPSAISGLPIPSSTYSSRPTSASSRSRPHTPSEEEGTSPMAIPRPRPERQMANFQFAFSLISLEEAREREDIVKRNIARD